MKCVTVFAYYTATRPPPLQKAPLLQLSTFSALRFTLSITSAVTMVSCAVPGAALTGGLCEPVVSHDAGMSPSTSPNKTILLRRRNTPPALRKSSGACSFTTLFVLTSCGHLCVCVCVVPLLRGMPSYSFSHSEECGRHVQEGDYVVRSK